MKETFWYAADYKRRMAAQGRLSADDVKAREQAYIKWWESKTDKLWRDREEKEVTSDVPQYRLVKEAKIVGYKEGMPVKIRPVHAAGINKDLAKASNRSREIHEYKTIAPALFIVSLGNKRLDSFQSSKNATSYAKQLLEA